MKYLLDTCVISELVAKRPNARIIAWIDSIDPETAFLSVLTIGEIRKGIEKLPNSDRKATLQGWLRDELPIMFSGRILSFDFQVALKWGEMAGGLESRGKKLAAIDSLIAATALYHHCRLVTRNEDDFKYADIPVLNPWL
ncbi:MAG: type II toxin-antitoxin system VapC family toxin [Desulfobacterales bacterium]|nr:type II toxin-antitoxin system VapC family toxin [Desulfobacterales bacterium]